MLKPHRPPLLAVLTLIVPLAALLVGCAGAQGPVGPEGAQGPPGPQGPAGPPADTAGSIPAYVGSAICAGCHEDITANFMTTGHAHAMTAVVDGAAPDLDIDEPPVGWEEVGYVIGGYHWQARFVGLDGHLITGDDAQYNLENEELDLGGNFAAWDPSEPPDCGTCHTTGYTQDGNSPLSGSFAEPGVTCESCHGPGSLHINDPDVFAVEINTDSTLCLGCHTNSNALTADASGLFIAHDLTYPNTYISKHATLDCVECHSPHGGEASAPADTCESCHWQEAEFQPAGHTFPQCVDCHMAPIAVNALADEESLRGDFSAHLFAINPYAESQFEDGVSANYITIPYACATCHSESGIVGPMDVETLRDLAQGYHDRPEEVVEP